jgi:hypothetical protein
VWAHAERWRTHLEGIVKRRLEVFPCLHLWRIYG